ncbi:MAG: DinB family protein [Rubripirellula sp.]|nr:DinB family protein [Rubripirellula sp.]
MYDKDRIIYQLERTRVLSLQMIERVPHDQWFEMPTGVTHVAWNVGHMATAEYFLGMVFVRGARENDCDLIPENFAELFGYGSVANSDPTSYPSPSEILEVLGSVHATLLDEIRAMPAEELSQPCKFLEGEFDHHPVFEEKGGALEWLGYHEHVHIGAIGLLRRELGSKPIEYFQESREGKRFA